MRRLVPAALLVVALAGCTAQPEPAVTPGADFCTQLIAGSADHTRFATAVIDGASVSDYDRSVADGYVAALRATAPDDDDLAAALVVLTTPYETDRHASGQNDAPPDPIDADQLSEATSTLPTACATS